MNDLALFLQLSVQLATPFLLATLGGILCEKVGHLNLGIEGMMMLGALSGFITSYNTTNPFLGIVMAAIGGVLGSLIYAFITVTLKGNQTVTGFAITTFGVGFANFAGMKYQSFILPPEITGALGTKELPGLSHIPIFGKMIFSQSPLVYFSIIIAVVLFLYFKKTRFGLAARIVGESPSTADAVGINVDLYKYVHILVGGALCGLAGGYLSMVYVPYWQNDITAGIGWIAVALIIFSAWNPVRAIFSCYLFGILKGLAIKYQGTSLAIGGLELSLSSQIMDMMPYVLTIVVLVITAVSSKNKSVGPASVGRSYFGEDR